MRRSETRGVWSVVILAGTALALATWADQTMGNRPPPAADRSVAEQRPGKPTPPQKTATAARTERDAAIARARIEGTSPSIDRIAMPGRLSSTRKKGSPEAPRVNRAGGRFLLGGPAGPVPTVGIPVTAQSVSGGLVCEQPGPNCQDRDNSAGLTSDRRGFVVADDFTPHTSGSITTVCWWGAHFDFEAQEECHGALPDTFVVSYYEDAGGVPGTLLASFAQADQTLSVDGLVRTGRLVAGGPHEYEYSATHNPVTVQAGQCYWVGISNMLVPNCAWLWEIAGQANGRAVQDGDGVDPPDDYDHDDLALDDLAFCLDVALDDTRACVPRPPVNNDCAGAEAIASQGIFGFDSFSATATGPPHAACTNVGDDEQFIFDLWYCWTAPCTDTVFVRTCGLTNVDTKIAVYNGCCCPPTDNILLECNDDLCGALLVPLQSMVRFHAIEGRSYLIRVGTFPGGGGFPAAPGGTGQFHITCGPPDNPSCPGSGDCCQDTGTPGCYDETCCETVCACDPFCCEDEGFWDEGCAGTGFLDSGCGAELLCVERCSTCGNAAAGDCCVDNGTPACSDEQCCDRVCACDPVCCDAAWDDFCAIRNEYIPGCDAATLCPGLCGPCPNGAVTWINPRDGVVDARQPYSPACQPDREGIDAIVVEAPPLADGLRCWSLCETGVDGGLDNAITRVVDNGDGTFTVNLARSISTGEVTTITYVDGSGTRYVGVFTSHPADLNGDGHANGLDILELTEYLSGAESLPWGTYSEDADHSGVVAPSDILRLIDMLNGADRFDPWLDSVAPACGDCCP